MDSTDLRPINVTILHDAAGLSVSLSDSRSVARSGRIELSPGLLEGLKQPAPVLQGQSPGAAADQRRNLGSAIFSLLLPQAIRSFLMQSPPRCLYFQISESLLGIPWEIGFDGEHFLGEKFRISRQIVSEEEIPAAPAARPEAQMLRILIVDGGGDSPRQTAYAQNLRMRLGDIPGLSVQCVHASGLDRDEALRLMGESQVVHYTGTVSAGGDDDAEWWESRASISLRDIAALPYPPQLLVSENIGCSGVDALAAGANPALAKAACRRGLNILLKDAAPGDESLDYMLQIYRELARGSALGEAARLAAARRNEAAESTAWPYAALYGDCALIPFAPIANAGQQDHLRQVTVVSHDLVDSTRLLANLGAEKYSELLADYHARCAAIVASHSGVSDDPQGDDGIMCYFGVPLAHEDSAARALRAGLEIVTALGELGVGVRVGIATGQVVVKAGQPVGAAIHLAARLQSIAAPGMLVVSDSTRQIVKEQFDFELLDPNPQLKGFDRSTPIYRVLGETPRGGSEHFDAAPKLTPFVGRERELGLLEQHWAAARNGAIATVLVFGEAGIGKSRLVREFRRSAALTQSETIESRCAPDHSNSAFHPVIEFLRRLLRIHSGDSVESKLDKIAAAMAAETEIADAVQLVAALLSIPFDTRYAPLKYPAERLRQLTLEVLARWICREARKAPLCLIVEDIQWVDPSTTEFLKRLVAAAAQLPLFLLITQRSEPPHLPHIGIAAHAIELQGLSPAATRAMILGASGNVSIPDGVVHLLAEKADGVPLYIEESTRMAVEFGAGDGFDKTAPSLQFAVPATIQDLLMARLDRLTSAKPVAQLGGAIGREFSFVLLDAVLSHSSSPVAVDDLAARLGALVNSGLLIQKGEPPDARYFFKHALIRDAAYQSLWERDRRQLHRAIAIVANEKFPDLVQNRPEVLAHHYAAAGMAAEAIAYWERAARLAASRSAHAEALSHLASGLALVGQLPPAPERDRAELKFQLLLAGQLIATEGFGADQVGRVYARASELCHAVGDESALMKIQFGLQAYHFMRADFKQAHAIAAQAAAMASRSPDPMRRLQSTWAVANVLFHQGELVSAVGHMDACLDEYSRMPQRPRAVQDPEVICMCYSAWGKWQLGYADQAANRARQVVALSEKLNHKFSMAEAYGYGSSVHHFRGDNAQALQYAERTVEISEENGFAVWLAYGKLMRGRVVAEVGDAEAGIAEMSKAYDMWAATGTVLTTPYYLALQAEGLALAGRPDDGLTLVQRAFDIVCKYGERYYEAEIRRLMGELLLQSAASRGKDESVEAERWFLGALAFAEEKQLHSLRLRSAISLGRLRLKQGRTAEAQQVLQPVYDWFEEGKGTRDLKLAGALLEELRPARAAGGN